MNGKKDEALAALIRDLIDQGVCEIDRQEGKIVYSLKESGSGRTKGDSVSISVLNNSILNGIVLGEELKKIRKQNPYGKGTIRKNYTLSKELAKAIKFAGDKDGYSASRLIEDHMRNHPTVREILETMNSDPELG